MSGRIGIFDNRKEWFVVLLALTFPVLMLYVLSFLFDSGFDRSPAIAFGAFFGILVAKSIIRVVGRRWLTVAVLAGVYAVAALVYLFVPHGWLYVDNGGFFSDSDETYLSWFLSGTLYGLIGGAASLISRFVWGNRTAEEVRKNRRNLLRVALVVTGVLGVVLAVSIGFYLLVEHLVVTLVRFLS